jgi:hypothetical protein
MNPFTKILLPVVLMIVLIVSFIPFSLSETISNPKGIQKEKVDPGVDPVSTYKKVCGQCHMPYPPELLPSGSWEKLLGSTEKHFGETLEIDQKTKGVIASYLKGNGAEIADFSISRKVMQSLDSNIPLRLTEVPYILKKHRKIKPDVFQRKSIGSFSNCNACHRLADKWVFTRKISIPD